MKPPALGISHSLRVLGQALGSQPRDKGRGWAEGEEEKSQPGEDHLPGFHGPTPSYRDQYPDCPPGSAHPLAPCG